MGSPFERKPFFVGGSESLARDLKADGTVALTANWDVGAYTITALRFISDQATGTAPFTVASTTVVANLNASLLEGNAAAAFVPAYAGLAIGDILCATSATAVGSLSAVAAGQVLASAGTTTKPAYTATPTLTSVVLAGTGTLTSTLGNATLDRKSVV